MQQTEFSLSIQLYASDNHFGCNASIRITKEDGPEPEHYGTFYLTYDHRFPRFVWEKCHLSASSREYLELVAQQEVERNAPSVSKK